MIYQGKEVEILGKKTIFGEKIVCDPPPLKLHQFKIEILCSVLFVEFTLIIPITQKTHLPWPYLFLYFVTVSCMSSYACLIPSLETWKLKESSLSMPIFAASANAS